MDNKAFKYEELGNMQTAITTYVTDVNNVMQEIQDLKSFTEGAAGFHGETQAKTVDTYIDGTCDAIKGIVTSFETFSAALAQVKADYDAKQASISTSEIKTPDEVAESTIISVNPFNG